MKKGEEPVSTIDLHMHTTVSDGTDTPEEIVQRVREAGLTLFSVTDHDAIKGCSIIRKILDDNDLKFINGVEFSCKDEMGKYHILGYGYDPDTKPINDVVNLGHTYRMNKVYGRLEFLKTEFGIVFPEEELRELLSMDNPGKPHIGNLMVKHGYAETKDQAIREFIDKYRTKNENIRPEEAIEGIRGSGGVAVLAHPCYGSGDQLIMGKEMDERLKRLKGMGLEGVEAFYSGFTRRLTVQMLQFAAVYDLYVTAGSDYHGSNKLVVLGDSNITNYPFFPDYPKGLKRFLERMMI